MKKIILILVIFLSLSCSKNENEVEVQKKDCNCDRVVETNIFTTVGSIGDPNKKYYFSVYYTINDCTGIQKQKTTPNFTDFNSRPQVGQCK